MTRNEQHHDALRRTSSHRHVSIRSKERLHPYSSPIVDAATRRHEPRAHGGVEREQLCRCGMVRRINVNLGWWERGQWHTPHGKLTGAALARLGVARFEYREWAEREVAERALDFPDSTVETVLDAPGWVVRLQPGRDVYAGVDGVIVSSEP